MTLLIPYFQVAQQSMASRSPPWTTWTSSLANSEPICFRRPGVFYCYCLLFRQTRAHSKTRMAGCCCGLSPCLFHSTDSLCAGYTESLVSYSSPGVVDKTNCHVRTSTCIVHPCPWCIHPLALSRSIISANHKKKNNNENTAQLNHAWAMRGMRDNSTIQKYL